MSEREPWYKWRVAPGLRAALGTPPYFGVRGRLRVARDGSKIVLAVDESAVPFLVADFTVIRHHALMVPGGFWQVSGVRVRIVGGPILSIREVESAAIVR